jgi:hypothetical protein
MTPGAPAAVAVYPGFTPGRLLGRTFSTWLRNLPAFTVVSLIVYLPVAAFWLLPSFGVPLEAVVANPYAGAVVGTALFLLVSSVASGAVTYGVVEELRGGRAGLGALLAIAVRRGPAVIPVALVTLAAVMLGFALLLVPGVYLRLALWVAIPVAVVERAGILASLRRSRELARGQLGTIFGTLFVLNLFDRGMGAAGSALTGALEPGSPWLAWTLGHLVAAFSIGPPAVACAIAYHDLRMLKEGVDTSELAKVFE